MKDARVSALSQTRPFYYSCTPTVPSSSTERPDIGAQAQNKRGPRTHWRRGQIILGLKHLYSLCWWDCVLIKCLPKHTHAKIKTFILMIFDYVLRVVLIQSWYCLRDHTNLGIQSSSCKWFSFTFALNNKWEAASVAPYGSYAPLT